MSRFDSDALPDLLERLYDSALDPHSWPDFLNALPRSFGSACGILHLCVGKTLAFINFGSDPAFEKSYVEHFAQVNPYPAAGFQRIPPGKVISATDFLDAGLVERTEFFNDWMKPQGITCDHLLVSLFNDQHNVTLLSIAPHASVHRRYREGYFRRLEILTPHLMRAVEINRAMAEARRSNLILCGALDALGRAVFVLDRRRKVLDANADAQTLMCGEDRPVHVDRFHVLHANKHEDDRTLSANVAAMANARHRAMVPLRLVSNRAGHPYLAWLIPIAPAKKGPPNQRLAFVDSLDNELTILMLLSPARPTADLPVEAIQAAFGLSAAEARLASALAAGRSLGDYAAQTGVSRNTVRNQLAAVFDRMGMRRRTELVATIVDALGPVRKDIAKLTKQD